MRKRTISKQKIQKTTIKSKKRGPEGEPWGLTFLVYGQALGAVLWLYAVVAALIDRRLTLRLAPAGLTSTDQLVSIIVPARNEARNIDAWLVAARAQAGVPLEIFVADDDSQDQTGAIAKTHADLDERVRVLACRPPSNAWIGKSWAAHRAACQSKGAWLLFTDADMRMHPLTVVSALEAARSSGADALSLTATLLAVGVFEAIVLRAVASLIATGYPTFLTHSDRSTVGLMWGGFMLVRREAYFTAGGHAAVRAEIAEDRSLAERLKAFGFRVRLFDGSRILSVRMYAGANELWQGWRKNFYEGVRRNPLLAAVFVGATFDTLVLPLPLFMLLVITRLRRELRAREQGLFWLCAFGVGCSILVRNLRDRRIGANGANALTTPVAGIFIVAVMLASAWRSISGQGQTWKDRIIH